MFVMKFADLPAVDVVVFFSLFLGKVVVVDGVERELLLTCCHLAESEQCYLWPCATLLLLFISFAPLLFIIGQQVS